MRAYQTDEAIIQNLKDAACSIEMIDRFMKALHENKEKEGLKLLEEHRKTLLEALHREQEYIDCLDYLVYDLKKNLKIMR